MNRHVARALSRASLIIAVIFVAYFVLSALLLGIYVPGRWSARNTTDPDNVTTNTGSSLG